MRQNYINHKVTKYLMCKSENHSKYMFYTKVIRCVYVNSIAIHPIYRNDDGEFNGIRKIGKPTISPSSLCGDCGGLFIRKQDVALHSTKYHQRMRMRVFTQLPRFHPYFCEWKQLFQSKHDPEAVFCLTFPKLKLNAHSHNVVLLFFFWNSGAGSW